MSGSVGIRGKNSGIQISNSFEDSDYYVEAEEKRGWHNRGLEIRNESQMIDFSVKPNENQETATTMKTTKQLKFACQRSKISKFKNCAAFIFAVSSSILLVFISVLLILVYIDSVHLDVSRSFPNIPSGSFNEFLKLLYETLSSNEESLKEITLLNDIQSPTSCADILYRNSSSSSGYYLVRSSTGQLTSVYCDMTRTCGSITGGWMRVAELDLDHCPTGLMSQLFNGIKTCIRSEAASGCTSVLFSSFNIPYSKVCGQVRGYAVGTVNGMYGNGNQRGSTITDNYLDGVSITSNTTHIWSFVAAGCVCSYTPSPFISSDWTCDGTGCSAGVFCNQLLWNTSLCGESTPFFRRFSESTTVDIEMRVCRDEHRDNEDIAISSIDLYVH